MGSVFKAHCKSCGRGQAEIAVDVAQFVCFCSNCASITSVSSDGFSFKLKNCPNCGSPLRRNTILPFNSSETNCPWCQKRTFHIDELMHAQWANPISFDRPQVGQVVHGIVSRSGARGQILRIRIENCLVNARTVPRVLNYVDGATVECRVRSVEPHLLNLEVIREVDPRDF